MTVNDIARELEKWAPLSYAEDFDNVGLLVGEPSQKVTGILVAHDALENVVEEAVRKNCNLIVCFHPIIFSGMKRITGRNYVERAVLKAIKNDIAIYAIHTAMDNIPTGVNYGITRALGLEHCNILIPKADYIYKLTTYVPHTSAKEVSSTLFAAGAGTIGEYDSCSFTVAGEGTFRPGSKSNPTVGARGELHHEAEIQINVTFEKHLQHKIVAALKKAHPYEEVAYEITTLANEHEHLGMGMIGTLKTALQEGDFLELIKNTFKTGGIRHSALLGKPIKKVAVLGGSGAFGISQAIRAGADAYVTADLKYHDYYKAEGQTLLADVGHYESERFTKNIIADYLTEKIRNFAVVLSEENTNPINYF